MNWYNLVLFLHVSGDIGIFIGISIQLLSLMALRRASTIKQVRAMAELIALSDRISVIAALVTIATGLYMALTVWSLQTDWIAVALASLVVFLAPLIGGIVEPRMRVIVAMSQEAADGPAPAPLITRIHDPVLGTALQTVMAVVLGIVFLMTNKPSFSGAILAMAIFLVLGLASGLPLWRAARTRRA
jgi:hypothetical protein